MHKDPMKQNPSISPFSLEASSPRKLDYDLECSIQLLGVILQESLTFLDVLWEEALFPCALDISIASSFQWRWYSKELWKRAVCLLTHRIKVMLPSGAKGLYAHCLSSKNQFPEAWGSFLEIQPGICRLCLYLPVWPCGSWGS